MVAYKQADSVTWRLTGLAIAATYLTKLSNLPLVVDALVAIIAKLGSAIRQKPQTALIALAAMILCAAIPIGELDCLDEI